MIIIDPLLQVLIIALDIYVWLVIISAILSWLVAFNVINQNNQFVNMVGTALYRITEPALRPIRRYLPSLGGIDLSPLVLILLIWFIQMVLQRLLFSLHGL